MPDSITLSAGVRQNLLALQNTADLLTTTQNRLATGKKVNNAFDNPTSFFTSQSLTNRANSLSSLLDQIGQAQQTLQAANQGLTSITALLQQALSISQQALQAPGPSTLSYNAITTNGTLKTAETFGSITGSAALGSTLGASNDVLTIVTSGGAAGTFNITLTNTDTVAAVVNQINGTNGLGALGAITASTSVGGKLVLTSNNSATSFTVTSTADETGLSSNTLGAATGGVAFAAPGAGVTDTLTITSNATTFNVTVANTDTLATTINKINTAAANTGFITATTDAGNTKLVLKAGNSAVSFTASEADGASGTAGFTGANQATGTSSNGTSTAASTDLFQILSAGGGGITSGDSLTVAVNGGATQNVSFGTNTGQVQTLAQLATAFASLSGISSSSASGSAVGLNVASSTAANSLALGSSGSANATSILNELGLTAGTVNGTPVSSGNSTTRSTLQTNFNNLLAQIDQLAGDASYKGINLLKGDQLQVVFNENNTSSLTIQGVTFNSGGLGLSAIAGTGFQANANINATINAINTALSNVQAQTQTFGTNNQTVQVRQDFTKNLINTLQIGSDQLVLADQNEESANLLTLQTRQQLSISALSISNQAQQAVLKLFP